MTALTAIIGLDLRVADNYLKKSIANCLSGQPIDSFVEQRYGLAPNASATFLGSNDSKITIICPLNGDISVSAQISGVTVNFPISSAPLMLSGVVKNVAVTASGSNREAVNVFLFQGA